MLYEVITHFVEGEGHGKVQAAVAVEVVENYREGHLACAMFARPLKDAGPAGEDDGNGLRAAGIGHQVDQPVAVHVAHGHRSRLGQHRQGGSGGEGAVAPAEEHRQGAVFGIDRDDIVVAVLIQVGREELGGA